MRKLASCQNFVFPPIEYLWLTVYEHIKSVCLTKFFMLIQIYLQSENQILNNPVFNNQNKYRQVNSLMLIVDFCTFVKLIGFFHR